MNEPNGYKPAMGAIVVAAPRRTMPRCTACRSPIVVSSGRPVRQARPVDSWRRIVARTIEKFLEPAGIRETYAVDVNV